MTAAVAVAVLASLLVTGATAGPRLLRRLDGGLNARPRLGVGVWTAASVLWVTGLLALGPLLAWTVSGPSLPGPVGAVCRRCLIAASPFGSAPWATWLPTYAVVLVPASVALALLVVAVRSAVRSRRSCATHLRALRAVGAQQTVRGTTAWVVPSPDRLAYALCGGGIVLSQGTIDGLDTRQLDAVLAHERAHLRDRHHLVLGTLRTLATVLGWIPLVGGAASAAAGFAEMAADDAARRAVGTRALAGALLALQPATAQAPLVSSALHAGHHEPISRVRRLVAPPAPLSRAALAVVAVYLAALGASVVLVVAPYLALGLTGSC